MILFDDIGSYPMPEAINRAWVEEAVAKRDHDGTLFSIIQDAMRLKIEAGVSVPNYPQFQDMNKQFLRIINDPDNQEEPFLVKEEKANIIELDAIDPLAKRYFEERGEKLNIRLCATGPVELYLNQLGGTAYKDILDNLAKSVDRFISNSIRKSRYYHIKTVSLDEPSIGINPQILFGEKDIADALSAASKTSFARKIDTEIHLHSPLYYKILSIVPGIQIIGLESAANPSYLDLIDKSDLEESDKFLRVGISRTDIYNMSAVLNEKYKINVWKEKEKLKEIVTEMETPGIIAKRLDKAYSIFGERIKYAGPDCGLGSWPDQDLAYHLLKNTGIAINKFLEIHDHI